MDLPLAPSYAVLCIVQGLLVLAPGTERRLARSNLLGLGLLLVVTGAGIGIVRGVEGGADALTVLATVATPVLAAACGWVRGWRAPLVPLVLAPLLYLLAWQRQDTLLGDAAGLVLIGGACLTLATIISSLVPERAVAIGLVAAVGIDVILVWGVDQVEPATRAVHAVVPPAVELPGAEEKPLPALQDGTFGTALMGWLDFLAPAVLGTLFTGAARVRAAAATTIAALLWGLLLFVTSPVAATVPVLAGLAAGWRSAQRSRGAGSWSPWPWPGSITSRPPSTG